MARKNSKGRPSSRRPVTAKTDKPQTGRGKKACFIVIIAFLMVVCAEGLFAVALRLGEGQWPYSRPKSANYLLFEFHPEWVMTPRKNVWVTVLGNSHHHNSDGFRGNEFPPVKTKHRIACIGGSTTYCIGVGDDQTWPFYLDQLLQPDYEVFNFGIPGHSSAEHKKLLPYVLDRFAPDVVIFQMGLNDLRSMNLDDPGPDYANFHRRSLLFAVTGACRRDRLPPCALIQGTVVLLEEARILPTSPFPNGMPPGNVSDLVDPRVVATFTTNLDIMVRECLAKHVRVLLLPQAMSPGTITETNYKWWAPYLTKKGIFNALDALNVVMRSKADGDQVIYAGFMDGATWDPTEFCDPSHLNAEGNLRLARLLKDNVPWNRFR